MGYAEMDMAKQLLIFKIGLCVVIPAFLIVVGGSNGVSYLMLVRGPITWDACVPGGGSRLAPPDDGKVYSTIKHLTPFRNGGVLHCPERAELRQFSSPAAGFGVLLASMAIDVLTLLILFVLLAQLISEKRLSAFMTMIASVPLMLVRKSATKSNADY